LLFYLFFLLFVYNPEGIESSEKEIQNDKNLPAVVLVGD
jgi:hypothetical protein